MDTVPEIGQRLLAVRLPAIKPSDLAEDSTAYAHLYQSYTQAEKIANLHSVGGLVTEAKIGDQQDTARLFITNKLSHPYLQVEHTNLMVYAIAQQEQSGLYTIADFANKFKADGEVDPSYLQFGVNYFKAAVASLELLTDVTCGKPGTNYLITTNCARSSVYTPPRNVQSLEIPHTQVLAFTATELANYFDPTSSTEATAQFFAGDKRDRYMGIFQPTSRVFRELLFGVYENLGNQIENLTGFNLGIGEGSALLPTELRDAKSLFNPEQPQQLPPGLAINMHSPHDLYCREVVRGIGTYGVVSSELYKLIASIFIANTEDLEHGPAAGEVQKELYLTPREIWQANALAAAQQLQQLGAPDAAIAKLYRAVTLASQVVADPSPIFSASHYTRGNAYSVIYLPNKHSEPFGPGKLIFSGNKKGGGGVESAGILKTRIKSGDLGYEQLVGLYHQGREMREYLMNRALAEIPTRVANM
jgi:hypothetical protein